jgi:hypothetical protein
VASDADELAVMATHATADTWIGITDAVTEGEWLTVAGVLAHHLPWSGDAFTDPDNHDCGALDFDSSGLIDRACGATLPFVCELE